MIVLKKIFKPLASLMLIFAIVLTALPFTTFTAKASSNMKISDAGVEMIKSFEGFLEYAIWDYGQWSIGYGTGVPEGQYPNGITREEAEILMRDYLTRFETSLNKWMDDYNIVLNQNQFDAMMSFIYNLGAGVLYYDNMKIREMIISGDYTDEEFIAEFKTWSHAGGVQLEGLVKRRQAEAELFLSPYTYYEIWEADVENSTIRLRSEPNLSAEVLELIPDGMMFLVTDKKAGDGYVWGYTSYNGVYGWCALHLAGQVFTKCHAYGDKIFNDWCFPVLDFTEYEYNNKSWLVKDYSDTHTGIDIGSVSSKTPVYATKSGWIYPQSSDEEKGIWAIIDHSDGTYSSYQHLSSLNVTQKQWVNKGDLIGYCGSSGNTENVKLHFEVRIGLAENVDSYESMQTINPEHIDFNYSKNLIHSVSHIFSNNTVIFTVVTDSDKIDKIKLAISSTPSSALSVSDTYTINENGNYVWKVSTPMPTEKTEYAFDVRSSVGENYLTRYYKYTVDPSISSTITSASHEYKDGKLIFKVVTQKGDYDRIKLSFTDDISDSLAVSTSYAKTPTGDLLWTIEYETDAPLGSYAFDLRNTTEAKYLKDYFKYDVTTYEIAPEVPNIEIWRITGSELRLRTSPSTSGSIITVIPTGTYVTVTEIKDAEGYTWGNISYSNYSGWCALQYAEKVTLPNDFYSGWYWPVPSSSKEIYPNDSWLLSEYTKSSNGIDITNVSTQTPVYAAKSGYLYLYNSTTAIIDHYNNAYSYYGNLSKIEVTGGSYVNKGQLIGYAKTKVHFEIRAGFKGANNYASMVSFDPQIFGYTYDSELIKSVTATTSGSKVTFKVVTQAGDFNRLKITDANDLSSYIKYTDSYEIDSNGNFVWTITFTAPTSDMRYAFDLRCATTSKYIKKYTYYDYEVTEIPAVTYKSVSHEVVGDHVVFTIVTSSGDYNRMKLSLASNISKSIAVSNSCVTNSDGDFVWTIKYAAPKVTTTYALDLRSSVTSKYLKEYHTYTVEAVNTSPILYSTSKIESGRVTFNVITTPGDYNRMKLTTENALTGSLAVSSSYTINSEGNYVWEISTVAPTTTTTYAFDLRSAETGKYLKDYHYNEVTVTEDDDVTPILVVSPVISGNDLVFTIVTGTAYNRVKVADSNNMSSYIAYTNNYVEVGSVRVWTITITNPGKNTLLMFDARATSNNKYTKNYYSYTVTE